MATYQDKWAEIESDPEWQQMSGRERGEIARFFARKVVKAEAPGDVRSFLERTTAHQAAKKDERPQGFWTAADKAFKSNLTGSVLNRASGGSVPAPDDAGFFDAASSLWSGANSLTGQGGMAGLKEAAGSAVGALSDPFGLAVDAALMPVGGRAARKAAGALATAGQATAARRASALAVPAGAALSGLAQGTGTAAAQGQVGTDALKAGLLGAALGGTLAGKSPALTRAVRGPLATMPASPGGMTPSVNMAAPIRPPRSASTAMVPVGPARSTVHAPAQNPVRQVPTPQALSGQIGVQPPAPPRPTQIAGLLPERSNVNVPPGGFTPAALVEQFGTRPAREIVDSIPLPTQQPLGLPPASFIPQPDSWAGQMPMPPEFINMPQPPRPAAKPKKGKKPPKAEAPAKGAFQRLIEEEEGSMNPQAFLDALDTATGYVSRKAHAGYGKVKAAVPAAARAVAPVATRLGDVDAGLRLGAERAGDAIRAPRAVGDLVQKAIQTLDTPARTPYPALNTALNAPRSFLLSDFGVPRQIKDWDRESSGFARELVRPTREMALDFDKRLTSGEQADAHYQASEPTYRGPVGPDAAAAKRESERLSDEALRLGILDQTGHTRWRGNYIGPREFTKHLLSKGAKPPRQARAAENMGVSGYRGRGTTDAQGNWRDYTPAERAQWGEIRHLSRSLAKYADNIEHDARAAYALEKIAQPGAGDNLGAYALPASTQMQGKPRDQWPAEVDVNGQRYVLLGDEPAKRGQRLIKKWGKLSDHYVREDVYPYVRDRRSDLKHYTDVIKQWTLQPLWKTAKTVGNFPGYFINNAMHNNPMLEASGGSVYDLPRAAALVADNDPIVARMRQEGWLRGDALATELGARVRDAGITSSAPHSGFSITKVISGIADAWKGYEHEAHAVANATDDLYRVALVDGLMRRDGKSFEEAARLADEVFYHPGKVTSPASQLLTVAVPFGRVFPYMTRALPTIAAKNPVKATYVATMAALTPVVINRLLLGKSEEEIAAEQAALPPHMQGFGNAMPVGKNSDGNPVYQDRSNWNPGGAYTEQAASSLPPPFNLRGLAPGGAAAIAGGLAFNTDPQTGRPIVAKDAHGNVTEDHRLDFVTKNTLSGTALNALRLLDVAQGKTTPHGDRVTVGDQLARAAGLKFQPVDVGRASDIERGKMAALQQDYGRRINRLRRYMAKADERGDQTVADRLRREIAELKAMRRQALGAGQDVLKTLGGGDPQEATPAPAQAGSLP